MQPRPLKKLTGGHRAGIQVALAAIAAQRAQQFLGGLQLDALCDDACPEPVSQLNGKPHDRAEVRVFNEWSNQRDVQLDELYGQVAQSSQGRLAGSEVVDSDLYAKCLKRR